MFPRYGDVEITNRWQIICIRRAKRKRGGYLGQIRHADGPRKRQEICGIVPSRLVPPGHSPTTEPTGPEELDREYKRILKQYEMMRAGDSLPCHRLRPQEPREVIRATNELQIFKASTVTNAIVSSCNWERDGL